MSARTTADEKIRNAKDFISAAYKEILLALDEDCYGHSDLGTDYIDSLQETAMELLKIKRKL